MAGPTEYRKTTEMTEMGPSEENEPSSEMRSSEQKPPRMKEEFSDDDEGVPLKRSQNGKWWYATYHNVTAIVGSGVLGLPTAMVYLGWAGGTVALVLSWGITLYTLWQMVEMYELEGQPRSSTYHELGQKAFGDRLGLWIVLPQQLTVFIGADIVYMVTGGESLWLFYQLLRCNVFRPLKLDPVALGTGDQCCGKTGRATFTVFFAIIQLFLAQLDGFNSIARISLGASLMAICYCIIAAVEAGAHGVVNHEYSPPELSINSTCKTSYHIPGDTAHQVFGVFSALGILAFAYAGHNVVLEIQETLPSSKEKPSKHAMWRGVLVAYIIVAMCYFPVAILGYWAFGNVLASIGNSRRNPSNGNILLQLGHPVGVIAAANMMVFIHVTGSYLVYAMPAFDLMEKILVEKYHVLVLIENIFVKFRFARPTTKRSITVTRLLTRSVYVCFTAFIAFTFPFFQDLLAFFGGVAFTPTTYFLPCIIWLRLMKPKAFTLVWFFNWFCIVLGVLLTLCATIGGMRTIIVDSSHYKFYQLFHCHPHTTGPPPILCPKRVYFS
ncbi:unnamed protein product [Calypogeia fissa]